jgi:Flp pilus assembly protein TadG
MKTPSKTRQRSSGQALVEMALVLPILFVMVFAILDFGLGLRAWISITNSAREGARVGAVRGTCDAIMDRVKATSGGLVTDDDQITITPATCNGAAGSSVIVNVNYDYDLITPLGGMLKFLGASTFPSTFNIQSSSDMRVE